MMNLRERTIYTIKGNKGSKATACYLNGFHYEGSNPLSTKGDYKVYSLVLLDNEQEYVDSMYISEKNNIGENQWYDYNTNEVFTIGEEVERW